MLRHTRQRLKRGHFLGLFSVFFKKWSCATGTLVGCRGGLIRSCFACYFRYSDVFWANDHVVCFLARVF